MVSDHLTRLTYFFPWSLVIALLIAVLFAVLGVILFTRAIKKGDQDSSQKETYPLLEKFQTFFARFGLFPTDPLSESFASALKILQAFIGGTQFRYQLPWIVTVGASGSGKSSVLQALDLDRPVGRPHFGGEGEDKPLCDWYFYDHGIVLDVDGKIVLNASQAISDEENWQLFLNLLAHHRPKRPLDGIFLTIPSSEVTGQTALSHDDLMVRAEYLYRKLWQMQRLTGMRVPVYIVVTKCDLVPGFQEFCQSIPPHNKRDIFGWSNDHSIDSAYATEWVDEAFSSVNDSLYRVQEEIYADGKKVDGRDGVFLFPLSFNQLKGGIRTYTDHLFKASGYHESFFLRGIYFTGDSHVEKEASKPQSSLNLPLSFRQENVPEKRNLYFISNLFENKIFREIGLARPVSRVLLGNTTAMRFAKIGVALAAIIGTLGLLRANENLQNAKTNLVPALNQVEITLGKIKNQNEGTDIGRFFFDEQAHVLLNAMTQISVNNLSSVFIPPSWFDNLDSKIKYVMSLAYDRVILRSMAGQLDYNADQLVSLGTIIPVTQPLGNGINPLTTAEFYSMKNYVDAMRTLEFFASKFNELGATASLGDVGAIIKYLFKYDMPPAFYKHDAYYVDALKHTQIKLFDFDAYKDSASLKLRKLFDAFQLAAFDPNKMVPGLNRLMSSLYEFSGARNYTAYDVDLLREVFMGLQETITSIQNPSFQWLNGARFNPDHYAYTLGLISGSNFFTSATTNDIIRESDQNFIKFRKLLAGYSSPLFKGGNLFKIEQENGLALASPSDGALSLQGYLAMFFNEAFMAQTENKTIVTDVPIGSVLLWDTLRLQEAVELINVYNSFVNSRLLAMPKILQPMLQKVAREGLTRNLVRFIADAEVFNSDTIIGTSIAPEDALLSQVQNYRAAASYLEQILFALKANNANTAFSTLKALLTVQTYRPLQKLDNILTDEAPYAIKMNSFIWWDGKNMAALEAFGVSNLTELKNYLELQRDRINYLAREFAEPLVIFLEQVNKEGMPGNLPLVTKWAGIISELNGYDRKSPGSGLIELEDFIMNALNEVTLATCRQFANVVSMISAEQDFFVSILVDLQEKLHKQCVALSGYVSAGNYAQLAQFFNTNLAGKFPFVENADCTAPDANPEDIRTFFEMLDSQVSGVKTTLKQATNLGPAGKNALTFIEQMEAVRSFFGDYLTPNSTLPNPAFSFDVTFRVNKEKEVRANEILNWSFTSQDSTVTMRSASRKGYWQAGDPVQMTFCWALNSPLQPQMTEGIPNFEVQGEKAAFSYNGEWALLRLFRQHKAQPSDFYTLNDEDPITLRFDIPLTNVISTSTTQTCSDGNGPLQATVFVRVKASPLALVPVKKAAPESGSKATEQEKIQMGAPVSLPYFPFHAPRLNMPESTL